MGPIPPKIFVHNPWTSKPFTAPALNAAHKLEKRWQFTGGNAQGGGASWNSGWDWTRPQSWTGTWELGKLLMWTALIFACMLGGVLLIVLIFYGCGMLDDRRLKRKACKLAKQRPQMKEEELPRPVTSRAKPPAPKDAAKKRNSHFIDAAPNHEDDEADGLLSVSSSDLSSLCELIDLEDPLTPHRPRNPVHDRYEEGEQGAASSLQSIPEETRQDPDSPSGWSWTWADNVSQKSADSPIPSSKGSTNFEDLTTGRQWANSNRASARVPDNRQWLAQNRKSSAF